MYFFFQSYFGPLKCAIRPFENIKMPCLSCELNHFMESKFPWFMILLTLLHNSVENGWNVFGWKIMGKIRKDEKFLDEYQKRVFLGKFYFYRLSQWWMRTRTAMWPLKRWRPSSRSTQKCLRYSIFTTSNLVVFIGF